jgi:predicted RNase H-like HicB family nuclease
MKFAIEIDRETDGRWIAEVIDIPGVLAYGQTQEEAMAKVQALALRVIAERLELGEAISEDFLSVSFAAA